MTREAENRVLDACVKIDSSSRLDFDLLKKAIMPSNWGRHGRFNGHKNGTPRGSRLLRNPAAETEKFFACKGQGGLLPSPNVWCTSARDLSLPQPRLGDEEGFRRWGWRGVRREEDSAGDERSKASIAERRVEQAHLIRVQGTNYFPILWPAKI